MSDEVVALGVLHSLTKPHPEAFRRMAARLGVASEEILFFDDYPSYVEGARAVGLSAHVVTRTADVLAGLVLHRLR